jgi:hypothetical protein
MIGDVFALVRDARFPARAALAGLVTPFEEMQQEHGETADQFALLRPAHAVDFLGDVLDVGLSQLSGPQQFSLLAAPGVEIAIVEQALLGHGRGIRRLAFAVYCGASTVKTMRWPLSSPRQAEEPRYRFARGFARGFVRCPLALRNSLRWPSRSSWAKRFSLAFDPKTSVTLPAFLMIT